MQARHTSLGSKSEQPSPPGSICRQSRLRTHPPVAYHPTINLLPDLYARTKPDVALHIGVAEGRKYFAVEAGSERGNFDLIRDIDGRNFTDAEGDAAWGTAATRLNTDIDLDSTITEWQARTADFKWPSILTRQADPWPRRHHRHHRT